MCKKSLWLVMIATAVCFFSNVSSFGQDITGNIVGTVKDSNGAGVPNATVTITDPKKNNLVVRTVTTNDGGEFSIPNLPTSTFTVIVEAPNFKKSVNTDVKVDVGSRRNVEVTLTAGKIDETVTVQADSVAVNLTTPTAGTTINGDQVRELSINNRNFVQLVTLAPGVSGNLADQAYVGSTNPEGQANVIAISVNGARSSQNTFTVDGADITDRGSNLTLQAFPSVDSIGEFKVLRSLFPAESGSSGGGQINVVTRSGTNKIHGSLFEFVRNEALNANSYFNNQNAPLGRTGPDCDPPNLQSSPGCILNGKAKRPPFRYNNFGFTVGGPIYSPNFGEHDPSDPFFRKVSKTFFFFSEEQRRDIRYTTLVSTVPDANLRLGIFPIDVCLGGTAASASAIPNCTNILPAGTPFTSRAAINPVSQAYLGIYRQLPLPNPTALSTSIYSLAFPTRNLANFRQEIFKFDTSITSKLSAYYRFENDKIPTQEANSFSNGSSLPGVSNTQSNAPGRTHTVQGTYVASPNVIVEGRYTHAYGAILVHSVGLLSKVNTSVPVNLAYPSQRENVPTLTGTGFNGFTGFGPYDNFSNKNNIGGSVTWVSGNHTMKFGGNYSKYRKNENQLAGSNEGLFNGFLNTTAASASQRSICAPTQQTATGACLNTTAANLQLFANFLLGTNASYQQAKNDYTADVRQRNFEGYAQDEFRFRPNITLYYGVRYSYFGSPYDQHGLQSNFVPQLYVRSSSPLVDGNGNRVVGTGNFCDGLIVNTQNFLTAPNGCVPTNSPYGKFVVKVPKKNFAPRVGLAYDPFGKGTTSVRIGYGIYHEQTLVGIFEQNLISNPPYQETTTLSQIALNQPFATNPLATLAAISVRGEDTDWKTPYLQHWSLDVQHQLAKNTVIDVGYYGSKGTHLIGIVDLNLLPPGFAKTQMCAVGTSTTPTVLCQADGAAFSNSTQENNLDQIRPFRGYRAVNIIEPRFNSNYHSLQVSATQRFAGASQINVAYTFAKNLTDAQTDRSSSPQNPYDIRSEYGRAQLDRRHVFVTNYIYEIPYFRKDKGWRGKVLGGWQTSGIVTYQTGLPFTVTGGLDPAGIGFLGASASGPRPNQIGDPNTGAPHTQQQFFNTSAFQTVFSSSGVANVPGSTGRGTVNGPSTTRVDMTLAKNIRFGETMNLQLRGEAFNIFNHTNFTTLSTTAGSLSFGQVLGTRDPRVIQLGIKFAF